MPSRPPVEEFIPRMLGPKLWGEEWLVAETSQYSGKVLRMRAGAEGPLQYHVHKDETSYVVEGRAILWHDPDDTGQLTAKELGPGMSIRIPPGAVHRVDAITDVIIFEASTPATDDRVRVHEEYGLPPYQDG